ncbi:MAG: bifunctional folylpolyglutamate synthase/dihydrofolate synthase [Synergistaceae bacterium]|jgi:dihydrofolate synthase/folylpolyglutamate synthase|nr:bifunctional folylpolyglutamate synthase/dihydrofolate synthase [Synergistaceae bacterium]
MRLSRDLENFSEFEQLTDDIIAFSSLGIRPGLRRVSRLLEALGSPEKGLRAIHVLGTNGKGSTAAGMESILRASGMRTALYTSPHLVSLQERLRIDGSYLPIDIWRDAWRRLIDAVDCDIELRSDRPSFFENFTAVCMLMMSECDVDVAVIEAGMGGRYDATSVCCPSATLINPIGMDHMAYLGSTLEAIAAEKFAAVKSGVDAFYAADDESLIPLFVRTCEERNAPFHLLDAMAAPVDARVEFDGTFFSYRAHGEEEAVINDLHTPLIGVHQAQNAARVITTLLALREKNSSFSGICPESIRAGLAATDWPGRMEIVQRGEAPVLILDGAHNEHGVRALIASLAKLCDSGRKIEVGGIVFAVMRDKDVAPILRRLETLDCPIYCTQLPMERTLPAYELARLVKFANIPVGGVFPDPSDAIAFASETVESSKVLVCCGSLFLVGHLRKSGFSKNG